MIPILKIVILCQNEVQFANRWLLLIIYLLFSLNRGSIVFMLVEFVVKAQVLSERLSGPLLPLELKYVYRKTL